MTREDEAVQVAKRRASDGKRQERRLGMMLCAPAVTVMLLVTAYPILYAIYLSFFKADLRTPNANQFVFLSNYVTVLTSSIWWDSFGITLFITVISTSLELVLGMVLAIVMHRTLVGRGLVRTSALVPYAIVTVVAAFSWRFAWTQGTGMARGQLGAADREVAVDLDHHPGRGLEDDALHGAAADGRPGAGARGPAQGGLDGRRERLAAVLADHGAADEAGDPGGPAVPHPRRVPGLRQHLHPDQRGQQHRVGLHRRPTTT